MNISNKRVLKIIKLFDTSRRLLDSNALAVLLGVSSRTIRSDMKEVNAMLKNYGAEIQSEVGQGYLLKVIKPEKYQKFQYKYIRTVTMDYFEEQIIPTDHNDRISFIITRLLTYSLHQKSVNQWELADQLFISLSTLKSYWKDIKKSLLRFDLQLVADRSNGITIRGDEAKIRHCISEYIFNKDDLVDLASNKFYAQVFSTDEIKKVTDILLCVMSSYHIYLTDTAFRGLIVHIIIILKRADIKNTIEYDAREMMHLEKSMDYLAVKDIIAEIQAVMGMDISDEIYYLTEHFMSSKKFMQDESDTDKGDFHELIATILSAIKREMGLDFFDDKELISGLAIHLGAAVHRLRFNMDIRNDVLTTVKKNYPLAFELAVIASQIIENRENLKTNENEIGFLAVHFGAALERNSCKEKTAIVVCGAGAATAMLLKSKLQRRFGGYLQIVKICPAYAMTKKLSQTVHYVFSTVPLKDVDADRFIQVDPILTEEDLEHISYWIAEQKEHCKEVRYHDFFKRDLFFPGVRAYSKKEVLDKLTGKMQQGGYLDAQVVQSIFDREAMASTELGGLIAIPHALENNLQKPAIAVGILENPIVWDKEKVQVVFLISISKNKYDVWEPCFKKIYQHFVRNLGVNELIRNPSFDQLIQILTRV